MLHTVFRGLLGAVLVAGLAGCGVEESAPPQQPPVAGQQSAIIRGTDNKGDDAIVAIVALIEGKEGQGLCTGTLIAPTVILTAAHCVDPAVLGGPAKFAVVSDWNLADGDVPEPNIHRVTSVHWDPQFDINNVLGGHDIAVMILETPMSATPIAWNDEPLPATLAKSQVRIVGYGLSDGFNQTGAGVKRTAMTMLNSFDDLIIQTGGLMSPRICMGDSGGPVLATINGVEKVIGVNSFGFAFCIASGQSTRVDTYKDFVRPFLTAPPVDPPAPPVEPPVQPVQPVEPPAPPAP